MGYQIDRNVSYCETGRLWRERNKKTLRNEPTSSRWVEDACPLFEMKRDESFLIPAKDTGKWRIKALKLAPKLFSILREDEEKSRVFRYR